jgi:hypothetical protein
MRGSFEFGFEDGFLFSPPRQVSGNPVSLTSAEQGVMAQRVLAGLLWEGNSVRIFPGQDYEKQN